MYNYRLKLRYDGTKYNGWQRIPQGKGVSIQGKIEAVLSQRLATEIQIIGSGRTDAGVHALEQVANFHSEQCLDPREIQTYLNRYLPEDIRVTEVFEVDERFHARFHALEKTYVYKVWVGEVMDPFMRKYCYHHQQKLNLGDIGRAIQILQGTHDFVGFSSLKKSKKSTVRSIHKLTYYQDGDLLEFEIIGDGFLWNMVRIIVGSLLEVGVGKLTIDQIKATLASGQRAEVGFTVPPMGLYLKEVKY